MAWVQVHRWLISAAAIQMPRNYQMDSLFLSPRERMGEKDVRWAILGTRARDEGQRASACKCQMKHKMKMNIGSCKCNCNMATVATAIAMATPTAAPPASPVLWYVHRFSFHSNHFGNVAQSSETLPPLSRYSCLLLPLQTAGIKASAIAFSTNQPVVVDIVVVVAAVARNGYRFALIRFYIRSINVALLLHFQFYTIPN